MKANRYHVVFQWIMYTVATLQFLRVYLYRTTFYLNLPAYLTGHERLPFQERVLPVFFLDLFYKSPWIMHHVMTHDQGAFSREAGPFFFLSLFSIALCCFFLLKLYDAVSTHHTLRVMVYPVFLVTLMLTYSSHLEQNYSYPYDFAAIAFFTAGVYFIYTRRFVPLLLVMLLGTFNRETTLFLLGIYALDSATIDGLAQPTPNRPFAPIWKRLALRQIPWLRLLLLSAIWIGVKLLLAHLYGHNDRSEDYVRIRENLTRLTPRLIPAILNLCGYLLPVAWVLRNYIRPSRFGNYIYVLPLWIAIMFYSGIIVEVRIYGELCSYAVIACILLLEQSAASRTSTEPRTEAPEYRSA